MAWLSKEELSSIGFLALGENVFISDRASIYGGEKIAIGHHVRIDDFCVLSAGADGFELGNYIHIAAYASMIGAGKITMGDFSGLSGRVSVYSSNDDYSGSAMTNPMVPRKFTNVTHAAVHLGRHALVGSGSIILPGVTIENGAVVGALSLVNRDCGSFGIYAGVPAKRIGDRKKDLLRREAELMQQLPTAKI